MSFDIVNPASLDAPKGWNHGMLAPSHGRLLLVAGQVGVTAAEAVDPPPFVEQFTRALDRVLAVVAAAGGGPADVGRLTVYVTDLDAYRASLKALGEGWRARFGTHYPAIALVGVQGLVDPGAVVEIEATAVVPA